MKIGDAEGFPTKPNLGHISDALASYRKAGVIYRRIAAKDSAYLPNLASYYLRYAGLVRFAHNPKQARQLSEFAIQTFDRMRANGKLNAQMEYSYIGVWCTAGDMDEDMGQFRLAWTEFSRCGDLARAQLTRKRDQQILYAVGEADERIQSAARELGHLTEALRALDENQTVLNELLAAEPRNPAFHRLQALVYQDRSEAYDYDLRPSLGDPAQALPWARRYLAMAQEMVQSDPLNASARMSRAIATYEVSYPLREFDADAAVKMAQDSVGMFDKMIAARQSSYLIASNRLQALQCLVEALLKAGRKADARRTAELALGQEHEIIAENPAEWVEQHKLVQLLILAGEASAATHELKSAESLLREARTVAKPIAQGGELTDVLPLANADRALGNFYARCQWVKDARACYQELNQLWQSFPETNEYAVAQKAAGKRLLLSLPPG